MLWSSEYLKALTEKTSKDTTRQNEQHNFECGQESSCCLADFWTLCTKILATTVNRNGDWFIINRHLFSRVHETGHLLNAKHLACYSQSQKGKRGARLSVFMFASHKQRIKGKTLRPALHSGCWCRWWKEHICKKDLLYFHPWYRISPVWFTSRKLFHFLKQLNAHTSYMA